MSSIDRVVGLSEEYKKKKKKKEETSIERVSQLSELIKTGGKNTVTNYVNSTYNTTVDAPIKSVANRMQNLELENTFDVNMKGVLAKKEESNWIKNIFQTPEIFKGNLRRFDDGYQKGDILGTIGETLGDTGKTIGGTLGDIGLGVVKGIANVGEGIGDAVTYGTAQVYDWVGKDERADQLRRNASEDLINKTFEKPQSYVNKRSVVGDTGDKVSEGIGYMASIWAAGTAGGQVGGLIGKTDKAAKIGSTVGQSGLIFSNSTGSNMADIYQEYGTEGVNSGEAWAKSLGGAAIETVTEQLFGMFGHADAKIVNGLANRAKSSLGKVLIRLGGQASGEWAEEVISYAGNWVWDRVVDAASKGEGATFAKEFSWDDMWEQAGIAALTAFAMGGGSTSASIVDNKNANNTWKDAVNETAKQQDAQAIQEEIESLNEKLEKEGKHTDKGAAIQAKIDEKQQQLSGLQSNAEIAPTNEPLTQEQYINELDALQREYLQAPDAHAQTVIQQQIDELQAQAEQQRLTQNTNAQQITNTQVDEEAYHLADPQVKQKYSKTVDISKLDVVEQNGGGKRDIQYWVNKIQQDGGVITDPIEVAITDDGKYKIYDGHHRLQAAQELGLKEIPVAFIKEGHYTDVPSEFLADEVKAQEVATNTKQETPIETALELNKDLKLAKEKLNSIEGNMLYSSEAKALREEVKDLEKFVNASIEDSLDQDLIDYNKELQREKAKLEKMEGNMLYANNIEAQRQHVEDLEKGRDALLEDASNTQVKENIPQNGQNEIVAQVEEALSPIQETVEKLTEQVQEQLADITEQIQTMQEETNKNLFELTDEQNAKIQELRDDTKKWAEVYKERYDDKKFAQKRIKGVAMQNAAEIRNITQGDLLIPIEGGLTENELSALKDKLRKNYIGKQVLVDGKEGTVVGNAYGKIGVEFTDGTKQYVDKKLIQPLEDIDSIIQEQQRMYDQHNQQTIAPDVQGTPTINQNTQEQEFIPMEENIAQNQNMEATDTALSGEVIPTGKQRKWVETSTESEVVNREILPDDLSYSAIYYQPITNKATMEKANTILEIRGYKEAVNQFKNKIYDNRIKVEDIALGERLIQEALKRGDKRTAGDLIQDIAILGTELGQKVQALSIIQRMTPEGQLKMLEKVINRGKAKGDKAFTNVELTQEMKDKILDAYSNDGTYDQEALSKAVENVKQEIADQMDVTFMDKVNAWRYLSMLGNPKTHIRNIVSNIAMKGTLKVKNALARTIETIAPIENRTKTWEQSSQEVKDFAKQTTIEMKEIISGDNKYDESADIKSKRDIFETKILNGAANFNSDLLEKEDWWFSKGAFESAFSEFLTANGIKTQEDIQNNPELIEKGKLYATEQAQIATFRQYSWLANKIGEMERKNAATQVAVGSIIPFKKTPINIAKAGLSYSPLGFAKTLTYDIAQVKKGNMEASTLIDHIAQNTTGTALTLIGFFLAQAGLLNGGGDDDKEGKYDYQLGKQAYSLNIGGNTYSLSWLSPVAMPLFVGANAHEQLVEGKEWNGDVALETLAQTLDPLSEMSFLSSLDSVLSSYDSGVQKFAGIGETMLQNYATQFVPTASSQLAATLDDTKRSTKVSGDSTFKIVDEVYNKLIYKIPFLRETLEPTTDIWGNEVKQNENMFKRALENFIAPYSRKESIATEIDEELKELFSQTGDNGILPNIPYNYVNYGGEKYNMSAEEYTEYKKKYGQTANDLLEDLFATTTYKGLSPEDKTDMVNEVYDYARDVAKKNYLAKEGISYTNATEDGKAIYRDNYIKEAIKQDMTVDEYKLYDEDPDKYNFLKNNNISYSDYDTNRDLYNYAFEHQEEYNISKAITGDFATYYSYMQDISDFDAKDANGESVSGLKKERVFGYINSLELNIPQKVIMFKMKYPKDKDYVGTKYNKDIINYVIDLDLDYNEKKAILENMGMTVKNNRVYWD
jgi:hypothetical protein